MVASRYEALKAMRIAAFDDRKIVEAPPKPCPDCAALRARVAFLEADLARLERYAERKASTKMSTSAPSAAPESVDDRRRRLRAARQARYRARKAGAE